MINKIRIREVGLIMIVLCLLFPAAAIHPVQASASASVTLDAPLDGDAVPAGIVTISGTFADTYDIQLFINGTTQVAAVMNDPEQDHSGTWHYDMDTSGYSGEVQLAARGLDIDTRYGVWSPTIVLHVDNPDGQIPEVTIESPADGSSVQGTVPIQVSVVSPNTIESVVIRIDGGSWQAAAYDGTHYVYEWDTSGIEDKTVSIQAQATDAGGHVGRSLTTYAKVGLGTDEPFDMPTQDRAMWIWESETYKLLLNPNSRYVLDAFAKDTDTFSSDPVTTLYLAVGPYGGMDILEDDPGKLRDFIAWAHDQGYKVHACIAGGTSPPYMGAYEAFHDKAIEEIEGIINYNLAAGPNEKFDGVNVDIEPYISQDFKSQYPSLQLQYLDGLQKMINRIQVAGINLPFGPAIPKWYDSSPYAENITWNGSTKWLSEHILDISDYISIMDYRDTADGSAGIIAGAQDEINYALSIGKPYSVVIGVETKDIANSGDPEVITFREEGRAHMEAELDKVYAAFNGTASFGGVAMHHYDDVPDLPSHWGLDGVFWEPPADTEPPGAVSANPVATAVNYEQITIRFGMAMDNTEVDRYIVYRGTESGFAPDPSTVAGLARSLSFTDVGLLSDTTYYYKVAAMDVQGNIGPVSAEASATTGSTPLKPMILTGIHLTDSSGSANVHMRAVDLDTGLPLTGAEIEGRFHYAGGTYTGGTVDAHGAITLSSETIPAGYQIGFEPRRVTAAGYYWAQAYDQPHRTTLYPRVGLSDLSISAGTLNFETNTTYYNITVANDVTSINVTPTALVNDSVITVEGQLVASGNPSQDIALSEGDNTISIIVTGAKGETDVYTLKVTRSVFVDNVFQASEDTYVYQNAPTENYGSSEWLEVVDIPGAQGGGDRMAFMKFGFGAYSEPVQSAALHFYVSEDPSSPINLTVYSYETDSWDENTMNWNNRLGAGSTTIGTVNVAAAGWHSIDVTGFVHNQMLGDKTATFRIMDPNTRSTMVKINSSEHAEHQPYIVVNPSANANLSSLALSDGDLSPVFDAETAIYQGSVANSVSSMTVTPTVEEMHATVSVNGTQAVSGQASAPIPLEVGENTIDIAVTAQAGNIQTYQLVVTRLLDDRFVPSDDTYVYENAAIENYGASEFIEVVDIPRANGGGDRLGFMKFGLESVTSSVYSAKLHFYVHSDPEAFIALSLYGFEDDGWDEGSMNWNNRISVGSEKLGTVDVAAAGWYSLDVTDFVQRQMSINQGVTFRWMDPNTRNILVRINSSEHAENRPYLVLNPRDNAELESLSLSDGALTPAFDPGTLQYAATVTNDVYSVSIAPLTVDPGATVAVNGSLVARGQSSSPIQLQIGDNPIEVTVTARNGNTRSYGLTVTRQLSGNSNLQALTLSDGVLDPAFQPGVFHYAATVTNDVYAITITPTAVEGGAAVTVNGAAAASGHASEPVWLNVGDNEIPITITAPDGENHTQYTLTVTRQASSNADLSGLVLSEGSMQPAFSKNVLHYTVQVAHPIQSVLVTPTADDHHASVQVNGETVESGQSSAVALAVGDNVITVQVTAQDGATTQTYELAVHRAGPTTVPDDTDDDDEPTPTEPPNRSAKVTVGGKEISLNVLRTVSQQGMKIDEFILDPHAVEQIIAGANAEEGKAVQIRINADSDGSSADEYKITLNKQSVKALTEETWNFELAINELRITLPNEALLGLHSGEQDVSFVIVPIQQETASKEIKDRVLQSEVLREQAGDRTEEIKVIGQPIQVEASYRGHKTKLYFPVVGQDMNLTDHMLAVYIEHSDGELALKEGEVEFDENGHPIGIEIEIEKFSTFTLVQLPLPTTEKHPSYTFGYEDGTFRPDQKLSRAELAAMLDRLLKAEDLEQADSQAGKFNDVPESHWAAASIDRLTAQGMLTGRTSTVFAPDEPLTRAELAVIAARWNGLGPADHGSTFSDTANHWASGWIAASQESGWMEGYDDGDFRPDMTVTRAEAIVVINRMTGRPVMADVEVPTWKDVSSKHWAFGYIEAASVSIPQ